MTDTEENIVEPDVTGFGNPSLDSDKVDDSTDSAIDNLLDEVIKETEDTNEHTETNTRPPDENLISDEGSDTGRATEPTPVAETTPAEAKPAQPANDANNEREIGRAHV